MDTALLVPAALVFGVLLGVGATTLFVVAHRRGQRAVEVVTPRVPDGVDALIDSLESVGIVLDASNNVLSASPRAIAANLIFNDHLVNPELVDLVDAVRRTGEPASEELHLTRSRLGEQSLFLLVRVSRLGSRYILLVGDDRTEAHRLEEVRRDFLANVSHELKTPIGAVGLLSEALESAADEPEEVRRFASRLTREADRLARITAEIIQLSRLQSGDALEKAEPVEIDNLVRQSIDHHRVQAEAKDIELVVGKRRRVSVIGDPTMLATALNNLVANAIQYSPEHSRVGLGVSVDEGVVEIAVTDQGVGIPAADRDRVFERFYRVDAARARNTGGTGLGLSIVKHVAQNHGGDVRLWSQPGSGSTFTIRLPEASDASAVTTGATG
ncbi:cell wall metabolism sensor histidine kinase WalK [Schumannella sp. 10F1B-5-1]|uniref:sensor histidine kinase n=1 Tax=Schumannella sp. 10F1B-5-1 TaxID=2590780 RepID=UPI00113198B6|nr:ATP-binding protein [Schumannella sp. 10F1B-5-1]TPW72847.1 two-component sensor histidine kinase [Schumannella sp. 10F1B-5-1]